MRTKKKLKMEAGVRTKRETRRMRQRKVRRGTTYKKGSEEETEREGSEMRSRTAI
jgi:hypothetical protein